MRNWPESVKQFLPHPDPLPLGERTALVRFILSDTRSTNPVAHFSVRLTVILPLPAGEGRGEGERSEDLTAVRFDDKPPRSFGRDAFHPRPHFISVKLGTRVERVPTDFMT